MNVKILKKTIARRKKYEWLFKKVNDHLQIMMIHKNRKGCQEIKFKN